MGFACAERTAPRQSPSADARRSTCKNAVCIGVPRGTVYPTRRLFLSRHLRRRWSAGEASLCGSSTSRKSGSSCSACAARRKRKASNVQWWQRRNCAFPLGRRRGSSGRRGRAACERLGARWLCVRLCKSCGRGEPQSPGADVAGVSPSPSADVAGVSPSPGADVAGVSPSPGADVGGGAPSPGADAAGANPVPAQMRQVSRRTGEHPADAVADRQERHVHVRVILRPPQWWL